MKGLTQDQSISIGLQYTKQGACEVDQPQNIPLFNISWHCRFQNLR